MVNATNGQSSALLKKQDGGSDVRNRAGIANYTKHWNADSAKDTAEQMDARKESYTDVVVGGGFLILLLLPPSLSPTDCASPLSFSSHLAPFLSFPQLFWQ